MSEYKRQQTGHDCPPTTDNPADQPNPPGGPPCENLPTSTPPTLDPPKRCPEPVDCKCPTKPDSNSNCLEDLIAKQTTEIAAAEKATKFKADLEALLGKAKTASQDYTREKYEKLRKQWVEQDADIVDKVIRPLVCTIECWRCIIECHVCPLLNELRYAEQWLYGDGTRYTDVHDLQDLLYWHGRDKETKQRRFDRIKSVLGAWEKPAQTIEKALNDCKGLIDSSRALIGTDPSKAVYDVFLRLIPLHLSIAPPSGSAWTTKIDKEFTDFCECDKGTPDDCCGPDVGEWTLRQRLIGPQPYLIDPDHYFKIICCLVEKRYAPAKDALGQAEAAWVTVDNQIKRYKAQIDTGLKSFDKDAKAAIPGKIDCCDYTEHETEQKPAQAR